MIRPITVVEQNIHRDLRHQGSSLQLAAGGLAGTCVRGLLVLNREHRPDHRSLTVKYRFLGPATYLTTNSFPRPGFNRRSAQIEELVETALLSVVAVHKDLALYLDVTSANGSTRVHSVNAASALLLRQGLMQSSTFALSVGRVDGQLVADVDYVQDSEGDLDMCMGFKVTRQGELTSQFTFLQQEGTVSVAEFKKAYGLAQQGVRHVMNAAWIAPTPAPALTCATARAIPPIKGVEPFVLQLQHLVAPAALLGDRAVWVVHVEGNFIRAHDAYGNQMTLGVSINFDGQQPSLKVTYDPSSQLMYGRWARDPCLDSRIVDRLLRTYVKVHQRWPVEAGFARVEVVFSTIKGNLSYRLLQFMLRQVLNQAGKPYDIEFIPQQLSLRTYALSQDQLVQVSAQDCRVDTRPMLLLFKNGSQIVLLQKQGIGTLPYHKVLSLLEA